MNVARLNALQNKIDSGQQLTPAESSEYERLYSEACNLNRLQQRPVTEAKKVPARQEVVRKPEARINVRPSGGRR